MCLLPTQGPVSSSDVTTRERLDRPLASIYQRHAGTDLPEAAHLVHVSGPHASICCCLLNYPDNLMIWSIFIAQMFISPFNDYTYHVQVVKEALLQACQPEQVMEIQKNFESHSKTVGVCRPMSAVCAMWGEREGGGGADTPCLIILYLKNSLPATLQASEHYRDSLETTLKNMALLKLANKGLRKDLKDKRVAGFLDSDVVRLRRRKANHRWVIQGKSCP